MDVAVVGILVIVVVVVVVIIGVEVFVDVVIGDVEVVSSLCEVVADKESAVSLGISEIIVDPRCLFSHSATAVTPSCQES